MQSIGDHETGLNWARSCINKFSIMAPRPEFVRRHCFIRHDVTRNMMWIAKYSLTDHCTVHNKRALTNKVGCNTQNTTWLSAAVTCDPRARYALQCHKIVSHHWPSRIESYLTAKLNLSFFANVLQ